jgi:thiol-disulfide isomerase/thioredoxin
MARTESTMLPLGTRAPAFRLPDLNGPDPEGPDSEGPDPEGRGRAVALDDFAGAPALLVMFICNHCPFVKHVRSGLAALGRDYRAKGVAVVAINSNDVATHPEDSPANMRKEAAEAGYVFPYLFDETQEVARAYRAACTPDFFVFDRNRELVYRGQMDGARPGNGVPVTGSDLRAALDAVLAGRPVSGAQRPSLGCNIKWRPGSEPS